MHIYYSFVCILLQKLLLYTSLNLNINFKGRVSKVSQKARKTNDLTTPSFNLYDLGIAGPVFQKDSNLSTFFHYVFSTKKFY